MSGSAQTTNPSELFAQFKAYAASVRRDRRLSGNDIHTLTLISQLASQDSVTLDARIEQGIVTELGYRIRSCSLAQATTGILAARTPGITATELLAARQALEHILQGEPVDESSLIWPELLALQSAAGMPDRHEVALLPFQVLQQLLATEEEQHL
ncbi:MAG TPA: iron-sulfur cluster assembly scaffold protein [Gammaproteobacteria bacterium]|nr:iron-sulfur cluster assembly scaffold protein [Gammaproteobacteria bacterium]